MTTITLSATTGDDAVDYAVRAVIAAFERALPNRIRGYYVLGSYTDGTGLATSDVDLCIVIKDRFADEMERAVATTTSAACANSSQRELDIEIVEEAALAGGLDPAFKHGSTCVYAADVRGDLPALAIEEWARQRMHAACWLTIHIHRRRVPVSLPLDYPDPADAFYGYARRLVRLDNGSEVPSTRDFIRTIGWAATALVAHKAGAYVSRKSECHVAYQRYIGDEWATLLEEIYVKCREVWRYLIPTAPEDQESLRRICRRALGFENHFMAVYKEFLLDEPQDSQGFVAFTRDQKALP